MVEPRQIFCRGFVVVIGAEIWYNILMLKDRVSSARTRILAILAVMLCPVVVWGLDISDRYRSPRNGERGVRRSTELIVLHTTEAPERSSLNKLSDRGEAHYCVTEAGRVYRIVDRDREAFHAGRSMWKGKEDVDKFSIGIECVGYHDKAMSVVQLAAIKELVKKLQAMYRLGDDKVVCHSHVAYGAPNKWHKFKHRGRKRCGMLFATPTVRSRLGLKSRPGRDEDVAKRRLKNADEYLARVLYGNVDTMRAAYRNVPIGGETGNSNGGFFSWLVKKEGAATPGNGSGGVGKVPRKDETGGVKKNETKKLSQVVAAQKGGSSGGGKSAAGGVNKGGAKGVAPKSVAELKARGWTNVGLVSQGTTAHALAGAKWNAADTYYTIRNKVIAGNTLNPSRIEKGMAVWLKK